MSLTSLEVGRAPARSVDPRVAVAIVALARFAIVEHLERLGGLFETDDRLFVAGVFVRMVPDRQLAIGVGNLLARGRAADAEDLVIVAFIRHCRHGTHESLVRALNLIIGLRCPESMQQNSTARGRIAAQNGPLRARRARSGPS